MRIPEEQQLLVLPDTQSFTPVLMSSSLSEPNCMQEPVGIPEEQLPLVLPDTDNFQPRGTPESPLSVIDEWVNTTDPASGRPARRETSTMPQVH